MARAPDPRIEQAKAMYLKGKKLVEIASQLNLPEGTVRRWKSTHKWDSERSDKNSERSLYSCLFLHHSFPVLRQRNSTYYKPPIKSLFLALFHAAYPCSELVFFSWFGSGPANFFLVLGIL